MKFRNMKISVLVMILVIQCSMQVNAAEISKSTETNKLIQQKVSELPADTEPPVLKKVEIDKPTYQAGETVKVSITATDDVSGV
ncbi:hypothetical protein PDN23_00005, partial [Bacillus cereus]|nr:hypothetical protein [Bacillus cereus]